MELRQDKYLLRLLLAAVLWMPLTEPALANSIAKWSSYLDSNGLTPKASKTAKLNTRNRWNFVVEVDERNLVRQLAKISRRSAREEAYIHLSDSVALETGRKERFRVFASDCTVRATVQSSITIDDLIAAPMTLPAKVVWYHIHPSRRVIDARFRKSRCAPPKTWPVLPSSADISWFLERARKYYAARPEGLYRDRIVVHPLGVVELALTEKGKGVVDRFKWTNNYTTQVEGNGSMPGYRILPQRIIQVLGAKIDQIARPGSALEAEIHSSVAKLSTDVLKIRFIPMRKF